MATIRFIYTGIRMRTFCNESERLKLERAFSPFFAEFLIIVSYTQLSLMHHLAVASALHWYATRASPILSK